MAEEQEESTAKSFKGIIITLVSTVTLGVGGFVTNKLTIYIHFEKFVSSEWFQL